MTISNTSAASTLAPIAAALLGGLVTVMAEWAKGCRDQSAQSQSCPKPEPVAEP